MGFDEIQKNNFLNFFFFFFFFFFFLFLSHSFYFCGAYKKIKSTVSGIQKGSKDVPIGN